ncbi:MAG TPA: YciI family protein [Pseudolabrys sp.]|nr:YciI family protein [Pseudolabrys sp.]
MSDKPSDVHPLTTKFLGKEMYLVITRPVRSPEIEKRLADHLAHQVDLEKRGIMFAAGPLYPRGSDRPEAGMFVLRANSFEEAEAIANEDPLHKAGLRSFTLQKWRLNEGTITITINYSDSTMKIE